MAYCAICGHDHDPKAPCASRYTEMTEGDLRSFERTKRAADRFMIQLVVGVVVFFIVLFLIFSFVSFR